MKIYDLRTEYRENPAGLAAAAPRFSWKMKTDEKNTMFVKGIEEAEGTLESPYGKIVSGYSCKDGKIHIHAEIPANTTAVLVLPEKDEELEVGSGVYDYEYNTKTSLKLERFSMDSTLAEIVAEPLAVQMFNKFAPGMLDGPMVQMAMQMSLAEMLGMAPDARPMFEAVVNALNAQEE